MEYEIKEHDGKYEIVNKETGEVVATRDTKEEAEHFVKLLHEVANDPEWDND
jgi:hypothetical protein